ncbi:MAG: hypothetical protein ABJA37_11980 [Ferruginibacter sp.]
MKKGILYILLFSYSVLMLKPLLPYISDKIAHAFWYSQHMATVHYVDGKFHVHKEVMEDAKKNSNEKNPYSQKKEQSQNEHLIAMVKPLFLRHLVINEYSLKSPRAILPGYLQADYPPPRNV